MLIYPSGSSGSVRSSYGSTARSVLCFFVDHANMLLVKASGVVDLLGRSQPQLEVGVVRAPITLVAATIVVAVGGVQVGARKLSTPDTHICNQF